MWGRSAGETGEVKIEIGIGDDAQLLVEATLRNLAGSEVRLNFTAYRCYFWRDP